MNPVKLRVLIRNFAIEMLVYGVLVVGYFLVVLSWLGEPLVEIFVSNPTLYAPIALVLIIVQAVALEAVTSFLISRLGLERLE